MSRIKELNFKELKKECDPSFFKFKTTRELDPFDGAIGQARAIKAMEFGLNIDIKGYNIYIEGPTGIGKTIYAKNKLNELAKTKPVPDDWCYVFNFANNNEPIATFDNIYYSVYSINRSVEEDGVIHISVQLSSSENGMENFDDMVEQ